MRGILKHGRPRFAALLLLLPALLFVASLFLDIRQTVAQVATFTYQGPEFDVPWCVQGYGPQPFCKTGSVTAAVTIYGYASNYSGSIGIGSGGTGRATATISSLGRSLNWPGGTNCWGVSGITLSNGQLVSWGLSGWELSCGHSSLSNSYLQTQGPTSSTDLIEYFDGSGAYTDYGINFTEVGQWSNPKYIGKPCDQPGAPSCADPIAIGSGNVFEEATDYETAGPNKSP